MVEPRLIASIKQKKEFNALSDNFIAERVERYFSTHGKERKALEANDYNEKSAVYKQTVKDVRASLREIYGMFQATGTSQRRKLFERYTAAKGRGEKLQLLDQLLGSHQSTKERKEHFALFYQEILAITGEPEHILDLGCGYNPLSYRWLRCTPHYTCCDIAEEDVALINDFFAEEEIDGEAFVLDLLDDEKRKQLAEIKADLVFILKLIDTLEGQRRNITKTIIRELWQNPSVHWIVATFPLRSIGGKAMRTGGKENWFTRFLTAEKCTWHVLAVGDEELYVVEKH